MLCYETVLVGSKKPIFVDGMWNHSSALCVTLVMECPN